MSRFPDATRNERVCWHAAAALLGCIYGSGIALVTMLSGFSLAGFGLMVTLIFVLLQAIFFTLIGDRFEVRAQYASIAGSVYATLILAFALTRATNLRAGAGNSVAVGFAIAVLCVLIATGRLTIHISRRANRHRSSPSRFCDACEYDLTGNTSGRCPECGAVFL